MFFTAGTLRRQATIATRALALMPRYRPTDNGGPIRLPSGRLPSRMASATCASVHVPMPMPGSGVMFEATAMNTGSSNRVPPAKAMGATGPLWRRGVGQLPQAAIDSTR